MTDTANDADFETLVDRVDTLSEAIDELEIKLKHVLSTGFSEYPVTPERDGQSRFTSTVDVLLDRINRLQAINDHISL